MSAPGIALFIFCLLFTICSFHSCHAAKRRYFKFGGNWKSWREDTNSLSKGRPVSGRRSLPDMYSVHSEQKDVLENSQVELTCGVDRDRYPTVRWSRYGQVLPTSVQERDDKLVFPIIQLGDAGTYVCTASNEWDTKEIHIKLTVHPSDRFREQVGGVSFCRPDQATCRSGECIDRHDLCDGQVDCRDGSDEQNCGGLALPGECQPNEFKCNNGKCIQRMWFCDGDDDCGDRSDEHNCGQRQPGELCAPFEFKCATQHQCVPLAYQCDKSNDCFDGTDEVGCAGPTVVEPPQRDVAVRCGETITLTCRTTGVPVPYVNWRLNWGPVCTPPRCVQTSVNGVGTLTIRNAQESDQGAYTCEAVNVVNRVLATPDAIVRVYCQQIVQRNCNVAGTLPDRGDGVCHCKQQTSGPRCENCVAGSFYLNERNPHGCIRCFCSGIAQICQSSTWYRTQERLVFTVDDQDVSLTDRQATAPVVDFDHASFRNYITHTAHHIGTLYWHLPQRMLGNKLTAYGGRLQFSFRYSGSGGSNSQPLVIIKGNDLTAVYRGQTSYTAETTHSPIIDIYENSWIREDGQPMTREHFLMILAGLDSFIIRATHAETVTSTSLGEVVLDIAAPLHTQQDRAWAVEQCQCPPGYQGLSCEDCAPGYVRTGGGLYLGTCERQQQITLLVRVDPQSQQIDEGSTVRFRATISGVVGPFTYVWSKVGYPPQMPLPQNALAVGELLTLTDVRLEDYGTYRVVVTTAAGTGTGEAVLGVRRVGVCPYVWVEPLSTYSVQTGARVDIHCKALGEPKPRLYWTRSDGRPLDFNVRDLGDGTLIIENVQQNNFGQYSCHGENRAGKNLANATVTGGGSAGVESRITVRIEPASTIASKRYDQVEVRCVASGNPTPAVTWTREDGGPLHSNVLQSGTPGIGTLRIRAIEKVNAGLYKCTARNPYLEVTDIVNILPPTDIRSVPPIAVVNPREFDASVGSQVRFDCAAIVDSRDPPGRLEWTRQGGKPLGESTKDNGAGGLVIVNFQPSHAGVYECTAYGEHSKAIGLATLRVKPDSGQAPLVPEVTPKIQTVSEGEQAEFQCKAQGSPPPTLSWGFSAADGFLPKNVYEQEDGRLIIEAAEHSLNEGPYFCTATNSFGSASASGSLYIERAPVAPKVRILPHPQWKGKIGSTAEFECEAKGFPKPTIVWTRQDGTALPENIQTDNIGKLTISDVKRSDSVNYVCTATNSAGEDSDFATIEIESDVGAKIMFEGEEATDVIYVEENGPFKLECVGIGDPETTISWVVDMGPSRGDVPDGFKPVEIVNQYVSHDSISRANEGLYKCEASSEFGTGEDVVKVQVVPRGKRQVIILGGTEQTVVPGTAMELRCLLSDSESQYSVRWARKSSNGTPIPGQNHQTGGVLTIPHFNASEAGIYECYAWDNEGDKLVSSEEVKISSSEGQSQASVVSVESGPIKHVVVGHGVELKCIAPVLSSDAKSELRWFLVNQGNFQPIPKGVVSDGVLNLSNVSMEDAGIYSCVQYLDGYRSGSFQVVLVVSNTETTAQQVHPEFNSVFDLRCPVFHVPGTSYQWKRVSEVNLPPGANAYGHVLRIPNFKAEYAGTYKCEAKVNGGEAVGFIQASSHGVDRLAAIQRPPMPLGVISPPPTSPLTTPATTSEKTTPKSHMELKLDVSPEFAFPGKDIMFSCSVDDDPNAQIRWERIGRPLPRTAFTSGQQLKLRKVQAGDTGRYRCSATTKMGPMSVETILKIGEKISGNVVRRYYDL